MSDLFQNSTFEFIKPINFDAANPEFNNFKNTPTQNLPGIKITMLKNVRISNNSVVFTYFKIFRESCIGQTIYEKYNRGFGFFLKFIFPKFNFSRKRFILITDEWTSNYYHWHVFALSRLVALKQKNLIKNSLLLLPKKYQRYKFALASLRKFGIDEKQIVFLRRKSHIKVAELPLVSDANLNYFSLSEARQIITRDADKIDLGFGDKIYVSREGQVLRFVENEKEVVELLKKYGFKKILADNFSYDEQVAIFSKAKYLVGPHGAGLTNLIFMRDNATLLELSPQPNHEKLLTDYHRLISILKMNYLYQECAMGPQSQKKNFHECSMVVDLAKLEKNLKMMLEQK